MSSSSDESTTGFGLAAAAFFEEAGVADFFGAAAALRFDSGISS